jgi:predicted polyphosphate/ATP-dependent NAD kinase
MQTMTCVGFRINPIAGTGWQIGFQGTDGRA